MRFFGCSVRLSLFTVLLLFLLVTATVTAGKPDKKSSLSSGEKSVEKKKALRGDASQGERKLEKGQKGKKGDKKGNKKPQMDKKAKAAKRKERKAALQVKQRETLAKKDQLKAKTLKKIEEHKRLNTKEKKEVAKAEKKNYQELRKQGVDEVSNTAEAAKMRAYKLRKRKRKGILKRKEATMTQILFPGASPEDYDPEEQIWIYADQIWSKMSPIPYDVYDLPGYYEETEISAVRKQRLKRNLGSRLQGHDMKPAPFKLFVKEDTPCTVFGKSFIGNKELRWLRKIIKRQYRVHLELDTLPLLLKNKELNFAVRGYPVGFSYPKPDDIYLYNHIKFTVTYHEDESEFQGVRITGFDATPVSIKHERLTGSDSNLVPTCKGMDVQNGNMATMVKLDIDHGSQPVPVIFSYDVKWVKNDLRWADRWDVYLVGAPDDEIHYYSIVNSFIIVLMMTGAVATIMIGTLRKDIAGYNELQLLEGDQEETGWKLVHGDVFRPPSFSPMLLSVFVGTGAQIGISGALALILSVLKITNAMKKGQILTSLIMLYALCGSIAGYISARIYRFSQAKAWKLNIILTATALPGVFVVIFSVLNVFLSYVHAASAVSFFTILYLFFIWTCVATPLVFVGGFIGLQLKPIEAPSRTNNLARIVPDSIWSTMPLLTTMAGGILPFGSVCIELTFVMSALWLHQIYYVMGFLFAVGLILYATCAQVSIVMCYLQLCAEDHRWWWKSFWNCATAGFYLFCYSIWFLASKMHMVGVLPVTIYLTYMVFISAGFGLFCGSAGFLTSFMFTKRIYGSVKVD